MKCVQDVFEAEVESAEAGVKTGGTQKQCRSSCGTSVQHTKRRDSSHQGKNLKNDMLSVNK